MKKKLSKLTALLLSLTMALTLALPAWAIEDTPPLLVSPAPAGSADYLSWDDFLYQYLEEHPEHYESFDADAWFTEHFGLFESKEEFMQSWGLTEETVFKEIIWSFYRDSLEYSEFEDDPLCSEIHAAYNTYIIGIYEARYPGELDSLTNEQLLVDQGYTQTLTPMDQFMEDQGITDPAQARPTLLSVYAKGRLWAEKRHFIFLSCQEQYPEQWASFDADAWLAQEYPYYDKTEYMSIYDISSEEQFREVMFVDYVERESWKWDLDSPGSNSDITLTVNGEESEAAVTLIDGVSCASADSLNAILGTQLTGDQVSIRQAAQEAGWDVVWNATDRTVYLYRQADLPQGDFSKFDALMNRLLAAAKTEKSQSYKTTETIDLKFTAFNTLDGDKTHTAQLTVELVQRDALYEVTATLDAAGLMPLIPKASLNLMDAQLIKDLTTLLRGCKFTLLLNGETGDLYINAPLLALLDSTYKENTWLHASLGTDLAQILDLENLEWNTNDLLYQELLDGAAQDSMYLSYFAYYRYLATQEMLSALMGPQNFTEKNGTLTWTLNVQSLKNLLDEEDEELAAQIASIFKEYSVTLSADKNGKMTSNMALRLDMDALASLIAQSGWGSDPLSAALISWMTNLFDFRVESHASGTADKSSSSSTFHWKNQFKLEMSGTSARQKTSNAPKSAPPEGAEIVDFF